MMKKILVLLTIFISINAFSQVGIGTSNPSYSSILEVSSDTTGILIPRLDLSVNPIVNPVKSLLVWNTDQANGNVNEGLYYFDGTSWQSITAAWRLNGNAGTNPATHFLGTTDNQRLVIRTNNISRVVIGNDAPGTSFTNVSASFNPNTAYSAAISGLNNGLDLQSGSSAANVFGIENMLYLRSGSTITGTFRAQRNRLWNVQTASYPNVVGVLNEYKGEVTDITTFKGFQNTLDFRAGSNTTNCYGLSNEFPVQINGTITNFYGLFNGNHATINNITNYYGVYQQNLETGSNKYAFFYDGNDTTTQNVVISGLGRIGVGTLAPHSFIQSNGSVSSGFKTTGTITGTYDLNESNYTLKILDAVSTVNLPNPSNCAGRIYILIGSNGITAKNLTVTGGATVYDDVTNTTISSIGPNQRFQVQSDGTNWIVIGN